LTFGRSVVFVFLSFVLNIYLTQSATNSYLFIIAKNQGTSRNFGTPGQYNLHIFGVSAPRFIFLVVYLCIL